MSNAKDFLGKVIDVVIDRPIGSKHPQYGFPYETNYGYVPNTISTDQEELDVYYLGLDKPIEKTTGVCIAIIHRTDDDDDKLVVVPEGLDIQNDEIEKLVEFQEKWFKHKILRQADLK